MGPENGAREETGRRRKKEALATSAIFPNTHLHVAQDVVFDGGKGHRAYDICRGRGSGRSVWASHARTGLAVPNMIVSDSAASRKGHRLDGIVVGGVDGHVDKGLLEGVNDGPPGGIAGAAIFHGNLLGFWRLGGGVRSRLQRKRSVGGVSKWHRRNVVSGVRARAPFARAAGNSCLARIAAFQLESLILPASTPYYRVLH